MFKEPNPITPLPERMRPVTFDQFVGQQHLIGEGMVLRKLIDSQQIPSMIFWGPPGVGKTSLAQFIAHQAALPFYQLSAIDSGVKELRAVIEKATLQGKVLLFIDEIHRFNKAQQDALLGAVERGIITLIGATTENPSFEVISALLSRAQVYTLKPLERQDLESLLNRAIRDNEILNAKSILISESEVLIRYSGGDARKLLNTLEIVVNHAPVVDGKIVITNSLVEQVIHQKTALYDKSGEQHYDIISAFIKSIRGSDPNAAIYYLARMIEGGEDPKFIARRLLILSSEDIGNANPTALVMANNCFQAVAVIGYPECDLILAQTVIYLASSAKSNASYKAIRAAQKIVREKGDLSIPLALRNAPTKLMKQLNYGKDYQYAHEYQGNFVASEFLPEALAGTRFYEPSDNPRENEMRKQLREWWKEKYGY
jgi:putative ATPase